MVKQLILATMMVGMLASNASAGTWDWLDPHKNAFSKLYKNTTGGYSSWKARKRACHKLNGEYDHTNHACYVKKTFTNSLTGEEYDAGITYISNIHIPDDIDDVNNGSADSLSQNNWGSHHKERD